MRRASSSSQKHQENRIVGFAEWCVLQDLSQLKGLFPNTWETFIQNCGVTIWFGARDESTREYVSKLSGTCEVLSQSRSVTIDRGPVADAVKSDL